MPSLHEKIFAIEAAAAIANSMGDVTEGLSYTEIESRYGYVQELLPQDKKEHVRKQPIGHDLHYWAHHRPAGMTEDGQERHRLLTTAVIDKGGRITVDDLARVWARDIKPERFGYLLGPQDQVIYYSILAGIPPADIGRHAAWPGFIGTTKMIAPIGIVNAGNPAQAARDAHDVGRLKDVHGQPGNYALEVAAAVAAGVAEGLKPGATANAVIGVALDQLSLVPRQEVDMGLAWARDARGDWTKLRPLYADYYRGRPISNAVEILSEALAVLSITGADPKECILRCVNFGRDTDCKAYVAGCLSAALAGPATLPPEWISTIEEELRSDPYTVSKRSLRESADGLYRALLNNVANLKQQVALVEQNI